MGDENGVGKEKKKSLGNLNNFGGGGLASARAGISGFRTGLELSDLAEALQGHARGEVPLVPTTGRADWQRRRAGRASPVIWGVSAGVAQPVRRVCAGSREPLPEAPRLGRFASVRARGCVRAPAPGTGSRDRARSEQSLARSSRPRGPREGSSRPGGRQGLEKRADRSQAGRLVMEEQRVSGQPSTESQARPRSRESRGRRAAGSTSQTQNPVGSRARVPGAPARGARPPLHPEVCPSLLGPIVLPRFLSPPPPPRAPPPQLRLGPLLPLPPSCPPFLLPGAPSFLPPSLLSSLLLSPTLSFSRTHADTSSLFALSPLGLPLSPSFSFTFAGPATF